MDAEQFQGLLNARDVARDAFLSAERDLLAAVNGNGGGLAVSAKNAGTAARATASGIERVKRAVAAKRESSAPKAEKPAVESSRKFPAPFRSDTGPRILAMLAKETSALPMSPRSSKKNSTASLFTTSFPVFAN